MDFPGTGTVGQDSVHVVAKKKDKSKSRADVVRTAVDQAFHATADGAQQAQQLTRDRAQELADDLAQVANRFREAIEEFRPPSADELKSLNDRIAALEAKVAELSAPKSTTRRAPARRTAASKATPAARKPAAKKPAARKPAAKTPAAPRSKPASGGTSSRSRPASGS